MTRDVLRDHLQWLRRKLALARAEAKQIESMIAYVEGVTGRHSAPSETTNAPVPPASEPPAAQAVAPSEDDDYGAWLAVRNR